MKKGDRIRVLYMKDDPSWNHTIFNGDEGVVEDVNYVKFFKETHVWVKFDKGSNLALIVGIDHFEVIK